jgi:hydroxyacylglutathione hydrolase
MNLTALPAFNDNYIWMLDAGHHAIVVDPGDSAPVLAALGARQLVLAAILVTHHHADHAGGVDALRAHLQGAVYGPKCESIPLPFVPLVQGQHVDVLGLRFEVIDATRHTSGHIAYFTAPTGTLPILFCSDGLFSGGCGRLFEGTPAQMHHSLSVLAELPGDTRVCGAHECTLSKLRFARTVEPANAEPAAYVAGCESRRAGGLPTLPSSIAREREVNPFLRCGEPAVARSARDHGAASKDRVAVLTALREWKNEFP